MKNKEGIDTDKAMDEMSPPKHESGKVGGAEKSHRPTEGGAHHSADGPKIDSPYFEHAPMPKGKPGAHPNEHYEGYKHKMPSK